MIREFFRACAEAGAVPRKETRPGGEPCEQDFYHKESAMDHSNYAGHVHNKRRLPLAWLLFLLLTCLSSCTPARQEETVSAQPSYEQYSQQELQDQIKGEQEAFDAFTESVFRDSIQQNTISLHYYLADPEAFGITDYPITLGDYSSQAIRDSRASDEEVGS